MNRKQQERAQFKYNRGLGKKLEKILYGNSWDNLEEEFEVVMDDERHHLLKIYKGNSCLEGNLA